MDLKLITKKFNLIDYPDKKRKLHNSKTPLFGGLLFFICLIYIIIIDQLININNNFIIKIFFIVYQFL